MELVGVDEPDDMLQADGFFAQASGGLIKQSASSSNKDSQL
jgi:hypothetical protein